MILKARVVQDDETCSHMLDQPGCEVVLLQLCSMLQLITMPEDAALDATALALEALHSITRFTEARRQILASGTQHGRVSIPLSYLTHTCGWPTRRQLDSLRLSWRSQEC